MITNQDILNRLGVFTGIQAGSGSVEVIEEGGRVVVRLGGISALAAAGAKAKTLFTARTNGEKVFLKIPGNPPTELDSVAALGQTCVFLLGAYAST